MQQLTNPHRRLILLGGLIALGGMSSLRRAFAAPEQHDHAMSNMHEHHASSAIIEGVKRTEANYKIPPLTLVRQDGVKVAFPQELDDGHTLFLNFIYTSCTTVCPVTSQIFAEFQEKLGSDRDHVTMVSISIDPEYDTPARLQAYAARYHAGAQWRHYTGTQAASIAIQRAFDVYRGDKMSHQPVTFVRANPARPWVRLDGFGSPDLLLAVYHEIARTG